jgi:nucleotide-binding universal stress UspA family protein
MKILLAYDGFEHSRHALEETAKLAADGRGEVTVLSVVPPDARGSKSGGHVGLRPHAHEDVARAHAYLRELGIESEMKMENGDPAEQVVAEAATGGHDLVVVGSRGLGPVGRLLLGSVSRQVVDRSPCPVLVAGADMAERFEATEATETR